MIKFSIRDIPSTGLVINREIPKESLGLSDEEVDFRSKLKIAAMVRRMNDVIQASTDLEADVGYLCARCLEEVVSHQRRHYDIIFDVDEAIEFYDLGEEIRQEIIMDNPTRVLCQDNCQGICAGCGMNLNKDKCKCS